MSIKVGDLVALKENQLWAKKGAVGTVNSVYTEWDSDDSICWDLDVYFPKDQLTIKSVYFGKDAGLHFDDVEPILGYCMRCHKAVLPGESFDISSHRAVTLYTHREC